MRLHENKTIKYVCIIILITVTHLSYAGLEDPNAAYSKKQKKKTAQKLTPEKVRINCGRLLTKGRYVDIFEKQLNLILNEYWSGDGDWKADMMNDATAFFPQLLFKIHEKTGDEELYRRAAATCGYQKELLIDVLCGKQQFNMNTVFGNYCLCASVRYTKIEQDRLQSRFLLQTYLIFSSNALLLDMEQSYMKNLDDIKSIALPMLAYLSLEVYEIEKQDYTLETARKLIARHEKDFFDAEKGLFFDERFGRWNNALGLLEYAKAYSVTKEGQYLQKAKKLIKNLKKRDIVFSGVFFDKVSLKKEGKWYLNFSTMLIYIDAFMELYQATGDKNSGNCVKNSIDFALEEFMLSQVYPEGFSDQWFDGEKRIVPFFSHDIRVEKGKKTVAPRYCLGCVIYILNHIWDYNTVEPEKTR